MRIFVLSIAVLLFGSEPAFCQIAYQPAGGSELRKTMLDAARPVFERESGGPVEFIVRRLNVLNDWAFGEVHLQRPGGKAIDWSKTKYGEDEKNGAFDSGGSFFLLKQSGSAWTVVEFATGPTDIAWDFWRQQHHLSEALFEREPR